MTSTPPAPSTPGTGAVANAGAPVLPGRHRSAGYRRLP
jgi:hypothetical protein